MRFATIRIATASMVIAAFVGLPPHAGAEQRGAPARKPLPQGERIEARDGDIIFLDDDARVRFVRRRQVFVRTIFDPTERLLILLMDYASPSAPDGGVDMRHSFSRITGQWPLAERWEGRAVIEEYHAVGQPSQGIGLVLPQGVVQILSLSAEENFKDTNALAVLSFGASSGGIGNGVDFDEAERRQLADVARNNGAGGGLSIGAAPRQPGPGPQASVSLRVRPEPQARVGNTVRTPTKLRGFQPTFPPNWPVGDRDQFVMVLMSVGTDGSVTDVKVVRSVPGLDEAAIAAASQWRYAPELLDGRVTTYTVTAPVIFKP